MDPKSVKVLPKDNRKRKAGHVGKSPQETPPTNVSSATPAENGNGKSIWDENFPVGEFIDKHFLTEEVVEAFKGWESEKFFNALQAASIQSVSLLRCLEQNCRNLEKKCKAYVEENIELKKNLEELILKKSQLAEREEGLMEENSKIKIKLYTKENIVNTMEAETKDLKAEIEELKAKIEELRDEIPLHKKAGFDKAIDQVIISISELKR